MGQVHRNERPLPWREVFAGRLGRLTLGLFLLEVLAAMQILVVTTVMPVIARDLGGLRDYGWAFSASGLATVITIPFGGQAVDRVGPRKPFALAIAVFALGTLVAGVAPTMTVLIAGRFLQGAGAGIEYAVGLGVVAKSYPEHHRPRVLALLAAAWVVPGLVGPSYGALLATTIGWRWAFLTILPLLVGAGGLAFQGLRGIDVPASEAQLDLHRPLALAAGSAATLVGLTNLSPWSAPLIVGGLALAVPAIVSLLRSSSSRPGLPVALTAGFLLSLSFFAVDGFIPLMLTRLRGRSVAETSIVVTLATVSWSTGSWWQSRVVERTRPGRLVAVGATVICLGTLGVASGLVHALLVLPYLAWTVAGLGMGIAYPTVYLATMDRAGAGTEGAAVALLLLLDSLGVAAGTGLGGAAVAVAQRSGAGLRVGLASAFALALVAGAILVALAARFDPRPRSG